jgi:hypothetical protein
MMVIFVPLLKIRTLAKRWTTEHLPVVVEEQDYLQMVGEIERALDKANQPVTRTQASILMRLPIKVLTTLSGRGKSNLVADNLTTLRSDKLELILYPSDLAISGKKYDAAHARAVIAEQLSFSRAYLTWTKEANELEDRLRELWNDAKQRGQADPLTDLVQRLNGIEKDLRTADVQHEEWEVLFREKLLVERGLLQLASGMTDRLREPAEANAKELGAEKMSTSTGPLGMALRLIPKGFMMLGAALVAWAARDRADDKGHAGYLPEASEARTARRLVTQEQVYVRPFDQVDEADRERVYS